MHDHPQAIAEKSWSFFPDIYHPNLYVDNADEVEEDNE
jgi:hypothetical protein